MVQENEAVTLLLGALALAFLIAKREEVRRLPDSTMLLLAFATGFVAWFATVAEGIALPQVFNIIEHTSYAASSVLIGLWCWNFNWKRPEVPRP